MINLLMFCLDLLILSQSKNMLKKYKITILLKRTLLHNKNTVFSGHHLIGGCSNLIDENFELKGNPGVFICDASVFTDFVSSNIHAPVVLLSKLFSDKFIARLYCNTGGNRNARI